MQIATGSQAITNHAANEHYVNVRQLTMANYCFKSAMAYQLALKSAWLIN